MIVSNGAIKERVRAGALCCICEKEPPTLTHCFTGAPLCRGCVQGVVVMQRAYGVQGTGATFIGRRVQR